jgi:hypothetical protein
MERSVLVGKGRKGRKRTLHQVLVRRNLLRSATRLDDLEERKEDALSMVDDVGLAEAAWRGGVSGVSKRSEGKRRGKTNRKAPFCLMKRMRSMVIAA